MAAPLNPPKDLRPRIAVSPALLGVDITTPSFPAAVDALDPTSGKYVAGGHMPDLPVYPQTAKNHIQLGTITFGKAPKWLIQSASGIPIEGQNRFTTYATTAFNQMYSMTEMGSVMRMWLEQEVGIFDLEVYLWRYGIEVTRLRFECNEAEADELLEHIRTVTRDWNDYCDEEAGLVDRGERSPNFQDNRGLAAPKDVEGALRLGEVARIRGLKIIGDPVTVKRVKHPPGSRHAEKAI
ncbi:hypothetical protein LTR10_004982 [Elasticomyces elasticus]|nr:hypothetical protein LTR10_004982 [Elasticomyces elasticus]KAK4977294.1 hypothetical protein LTR42_003344 [Elasticomyces elasticus]